MAYSEHLSSNNEDYYQDFIKERDINVNGKAGPSSAKVISVNDITGQPNGIRLLKSNIKIPRPPNAFMIFANTWRKKLAQDHPSESNKQISVRLGKLWKDMAADEKELYFTLARRVDAEHKKKYPGKPGVRAGIKTSAKRGQYSFLTIHPLAK